MVKRYDVIVVGAGPAFANFHLILARIKQALDPQNIGNPTRLIDMERLGKPER